jgi:hypothetical protein
MLYGADTTKGDGEKKAIGDRSDLNRYTGSKIRAVQNARKVIQEGA